MTIGEMASWANVVFVALSVAVYIWLAIITRAYTKATEHILETTRTASYGSMYVWAAERLSEPGRVSQRHRVMKELPTFQGSFDDLPDDLREAFEETCRTYDLIGIAGLNGMFPLEIVAREWGDSIIQTHIVCERLLRELRNKRGEMFWNNFTELERVSQREWKYSLRSESDAQPVIPPDAAR